MSETEFTIHLPVEMAGGVWANLATVAHSEHEFTLDFIRADYSRPGPAGEMSGVVVSRVNISPLMVSQLLDALQENWQKYAEKAMPAEVRDSGDGTV